MPVIPGQTIATNPIMDLKDSLVCPGITGIPAS